MNKKQKPTKLIANYFHKSSIALTALAATFLSIFVFYSSLSSSQSTIINGIPNIIIYLGISLIILIAVTIFCYQSITIFTNKMILSADEIIIKRFFKTINISTCDIIRIDSIHERVIGSWSQNRSIFKIITNTKTYEVDSHEFFGLKRAILKWSEENMTSGKEKK